MSSIFYNGNRIIPAPLVSIQKTYVRSGDGQKLSPLYDISLVGKLLPCKGSPYASGSFYTGDDYPADDTVTDKHSALIVKIEALKTLFADDGKLFKITPPNASPLQCYPWLTNFQVSEGPWVDYVDYTVTLQTDKLNGNLADEDSEQPLSLSEASEDWQLEFNDENSEHTYRATHNVSAVGRVTYPSGSATTAWQEARRWVVPRLGSDTNFFFATSGFGLANTYGIYNHVRSEISDEMGGRYAVTETWILSSGNAIEDFTIETKSSIESPLMMVGVNGNIIGLESDSNMTLTETKWVAASGKFQTISTGSPTTIYTRAQLYSGISALNLTPVSTTVGKNPKAGTVSYTYEFDNRPSNFISGAYSENFSINDKNPSDIFASIIVPGRANGALLQDCFTTTEGMRSISCEIVVDVYTGGFSATNIMAASPKSQVDTLIAGFKTDLEGTYNSVFTASDVDNWNPHNGRYSKSVDLVYSN